MFPESKNRPALIFKSLAGEAVAGGVSFELLRPECVVCRGCRVVFGATMPEAAVYKDSDHCARDYQVRTSCQRRVQPVSNAGTPECFAKKQLRFRARCPNATHLFGLGQNSEVPFARFHNPECMYSHVIFS